MKKLGLIILLGLTITGCRNEIKSLEGVYSYKTSGKAVVTEGGISQDIVLGNEIGAMEIIGQQGNNVLLTFNQLSGGAFVTTAVLKDSILVLSPFNRVVDYVKNYDVMVSGNGHVYGKTIVFDLQYTGDELNADEITMIAKHN